MIPLDKTYRKTVDEIIGDEWGGPFMVTAGRVHDTSVLPGFVSTDGEGNLTGLVVYRLENGECEVMALNSLKENCGIGTGLLNAVLDLAREHKCLRLWLVTTNDDVHAIRFYQKFGFSLRTVRIGAIEKARAIKPDIPETGFDGIPILHEFEFEILL